MGRQVCGVTSAFERLIICSMPVSCRSAPSWPIAQSVFGCASSPKRVTFSRKISPARPSIHASCIVPSATSTAISAQQHPTQMRPCVEPARTAPSGRSSGAALRIKNDMGERQWRKHAVFSGVSW